MFAPDLHKDRGTPKIMPKRTGYDGLVAIYLSCLVLVSLSVVLLAVEGRRPTFSRTARTLAPAERLGYPRLSSQRKQKLGEGWGGAEENTLRTASHVDYASTLV